MIDIGSLFSLAGRTALVTGGSRGIGRMIVEGFIAQGARVYVTSRKPEACEAVAADFGPACRALATAYAECEDVLDILVNNAGVAWGAPFDAFPESGWDRVMDLNLKSPFFLTQALHAALKAAASEQRPAKVINIASIDGLRLNTWDTYSYQASKAGLIHLTRRLAARLISDGIVVSAIAPGAFASDMNRAARDHGDLAARAIPSGRIGRDEDMAGAAIYLASRAGDYVVGETLTVDGGLVNAALGESIDA